MEYFPIDELSMYQNKWTICARVTNKSQLRTFNGRGGNTGKVFDVELLDAQQGEIRASFFNAAAETYADLLQPGKCFTFSRGSLRIANKRYNSTKHRYELVFDKDAEVKEVATDAVTANARFYIVGLDSVGERSLPCVVDVCGVIVAFRPSFAFTSRDGKELVKREITIADDSLKSMEVTLWGERAQQEDRRFDGHPVVALKGVVVKEWNGGRSGSLMGNGDLVFSPQLPETQRVLEWWSRGGSAQVPAAMSQSGGGGGGARANAKAVSLAGLRAAADQVQEKPELFTCVGRLGLVQLRKQGETQPLQYMACQEPREGSGYPCNRRLDASGFCAACNRVGKAVPRLNVRCRFADFSDSTWLTTFHEAAQQVLSMSAEEVRDLEASAREQGEGARENLEETIRKRYFCAPLQLTIRAKLDSYQGEMRTNVSCVDARPVSLREHGRNLLKQIEEMAAN